MAPKKKPATKKKGGKYAGIPGASRFSKSKLDADGLLPPLGSPPVVL